MTNRLLFDALRYWAVVLRKCRLTSNCITTSSQANMSPEQYPSQRLNQLLEQSPSVRALTPENIVIGAVIGAVILVIFATVIGMLTEFAISFVAELVIAIR